MPHSPSFRKIVRLLQLARRRHLQTKGETELQSLAQWRQSRRRFIKHGAGLSMAAVSLTTFPNLYAQAASFAQSASNSKEGAKAIRVAVIGAGLAGLNAAYQLKKAGISADVFEARKRLGGRVYSRRDLVGEDLVVEMGGEFINSDHADMLGLVQEFGLQLFDRRADAASHNIANSAYYFEGKSWSEEELASMLEDLVAQINSDAELLDQDWDTYAPLFDRYSVANYLDQHSDLIPRPFIRNLIENCIRTEYGAEAADSSALQLLFLLPVIDGQKLELLGYSDETYTVSGGNALIVDALAQALSGQVHQGKALTELEQKSKRGFELQFSDGSEYEADYVIIAIPFGTLRDVEINTPLPNKFRKFIQQVDLGHNEKLLAGYRQRLWRQATGFSLEAWSDLGFSEVWDASQRQAEQSDGALTYFLGGNEVNPLVNDTVEAKRLGEKFSHSLSQFIPKLEQYNFAYANTAWTRHPYSRGAYVNYRPGQLSQFGDYLWVESEDPGEQQNVSVGNLIFAGEHLSDEYYGFMNGAAQTGRLAAQLLLAKLSKSNF